MLNANIPVQSTVVRLSLSSMPASVEVSAGLHVATLVIRSGKAFATYRAQAFAYVDAISRLLIHEVGFDIIRLHRLYSIVIGCSWTGS